MPPAEESSAAPPPLDAIWLGRRPYGEVLALQERWFDARKAGRVGDVVLFVEHDPVITRGRGSKQNHVLATAERLRELGVELHDTRRGGDVTMHAPGQLVAYPIVELGPAQRDVRKYVKALSRVMGHVSERWGVQAGEMPDMIGLWADRSTPGSWAGPEGAKEPVKLGAIGVRLSRWVTMHGFALNLTTELSWFGLIVPCGISSYPVATVASLTGARPGVKEAARVAFEALTLELARRRGSWTDHDEAALATLPPTS